MAYPVTNPFLLWARLALQTSEMLVASGQVIGTRVDRIARAGATPGARDRREMMLMGSEKVQAATESALAVATRLQSANLQLATRAWRQWFANVGAMNAQAASLASAALKPVHGAATANARRLARSKRR